jgi:hypothetical protein
MLLPDNIQPEQTIYFNGAYVLKALQEHNGKVLLDLFVETQRYQSMTMPVFVLCLDWLFLLDVILLNKQGRIELCS